MQGDRKKNITSEMTKNVFKLIIILYASILHTYTHAYSIYVYVSKKNRLYTFPTGTKTNST